MDKTEPWRGKEQHGRLEDIIDQLVEELCLTDEETSLLVLLLGRARLRSEFGPDGPTVVLKECRL